MYQLKQTIQSETGREKFSQNVDVSVIYKNKRVFLKYDEVMDKESVHVILSIDKDAVRIMRKGPMTMNFKFVKDELTDTVYDTVAGRHRFKIYTTNLNATKEEVYIRYRLFEADEHIGTYTYHLKKEE